MAHSLVGVEEVELAKLEDQHVVAIFLDREVVLQPVLGTVALSLVELPVSGVLDSFWREVRMAVWVVSNLAFTEEFVLGKMDHTAWYSKPCSDKKLDLEPQLRA